MSFKRHRLEAIVLLLSRSKDAATRVPRASNELIVKAECAKLQHATTSHTKYFEQAHCVQGVLAGFTFFSALLGTLTLGHLKAFPTGAMKPVA